MAVGNTFGATALSSYGGFWIGTAIILTPGGFEIISAYEGTQFDDVFGFYLMVSTTHSNPSAHPTDS
jgi:succinate-acetate transporter protein